MVTIHLQTIDLVWSGLFQTLEELGLNFPSIGPEVFRTCFWYVQKKRSVKKNMKTGRAGSNHEPLPAGRYFTCGKIIYRYAFGEPCAERGGLGEASPTQLFQCLERSVPAAARGFQGLEKSVPDIGKSEGISSNGWNPVRSEALRPIRRAQGRQAQDRRPPPSLKLRRDTVGEAIPNGYRARQSASFREYRKHSRNSFRRRSLSYGETRRFDVDDRYVT